MEYDLRTPYAYLMEAMIFVKAAAENGGKVDMLTVDFTTEFGYGEGEMFFQHFLPQFGKTDDFAINDNENDPKKWKPVYFELNEQGKKLAKLALLVDKTFKDKILSEQEININCPCTKEGCPRHGKCCECVAHHKAHATKLPACLRGIDWEK